MMHSSLHEHAHAEPQPRAVLVNSIPKAGTHLVSKALSLVPGMDSEYERLQPDAFTPALDEAMVQLGIGLPRQASAQRVRKVLASLTPGRFALWHVPYSDAFATMLRELALPMIVAVRHPVMVVASHIMHIRKFKDHRLHARFAELTLDEQVDAVVNGVRVGDTGDLLLTPLSERYESLLAWRQHSPSLVVRFEDLVGPRGGGDADAQRHTLRELLTFVHAPADDAAIERLANEMYGEGVTFRRGQADGWEEDLEPKHVKQIEAACAAVMRELGYLSVGASTRVRPFIVNSFPKSGTKLLCKVCSMLPGVRMLPPNARWRALSMMGEGWASAPTVGTAGPKPDRPTSTKEAEAIIDALPLGRFMEHHLAYSDELATVLRDRDVRMLMMVRDPRDAALSLAEFLPRSANHPLHGYFGALEEDERIRRAIVGVSHDDTGGAELADVGTRYRRRTKWLTQPNVCVVRFEDLVGAAGGGEAEAQRAALEAILKHLGVECSPALIAKLAEASFGGTRTFLHGKIGRWREKFTPEHVALFEEHAGDILQALGYERQRTA